MLTLGQLVYTSVAGQGFQLFASAGVPPAVRMVFLEQVVERHWNPYELPQQGYRSVYLHQASSAHQLFGWLYDDGGDEFGRGHVPYFLCYYLEDTLDAAKLENIFTCLQRGPAAIVDRRRLPERIEAVPAPDLWSYRSERPGVMIPAHARTAGHQLLEEGHLVHLYIPAPPEALVPAPSLQTEAVSPASAGRRPWTLPRLGLAVGVVGLLGLGGAGAARYWQDRPAEPQARSAGALPERLARVNAPPPAVPPMPAAPPVQKSEPVPPTPPPVQKSHSASPAKVDATRRGAAAKSARPSPVLRKRNTGSSRRVAASPDRARKKVVLKSEPSPVTNARRDAPRTTTRTRRSAYLARDEARAVRRTELEYGPSQALEMYLARERAQAAADAERMYGLWRKNRKR
ncbi:MAG: hypothetical protein KME03_02310 [Aphanocapsa lilacina HA4352-LM1]|jgi:hypothetical protein|nr:hypothetical protein [Aphanocapsa lilacina HA4352-LM1]